MTESIKDFAIFYPEDLEEFANKLDISLKKNDVTNFPTYGGGTLEKAANGSKFRVFLINSEFLTEEMDEHRPILDNHCTTANTLIILDDKTSLEQHPDFEKFVHAFVDGLTLRNVKKVVKLIVDFVENVSEKSSDDGHNTTLNHSRTTSPESNVYKRNLRSTTIVSPPHDSPDKKQQKKPQKSPKTGPKQSSKTPQPGYSPDKKTKQNDQPKDKNGHKQSSKAPQLIAGIIGLFIAFSVVFSVYETAKEDRELSTVEKFVERIELMQSQFDQDPRFWRTVRSTMKRHIIDEDPRQPTILMLVSTKHAADAREKLAREIAQAYSARCNDMDPIWVYGNDYVARDHADVKERIDDKISTGFHASACATVISNFEKLPPASTTTFYQFCENDQAPFKKVAVIFTVEISHGSWDSENKYGSLQEGEMPPPKLWDQITEAYLYHSLQSRDRTGIMKNEMIGGLMSRITPAVVWVKK